MAVISLFAPKSISVYAGKVTPQTDPAFIYFNSQESNTHPGVESAMKTSVYPLIIVIADEPPEL